MGFSKRYRWSEEEEKFFVRLLKKRSTEVAPWGAKKRIRQLYSREQNSCKSKAQTHSANRNDELECGEAQNSAAEIARESNYSFAADSDMADVDNSNERMVRHQVSVRSNTNLNKHTSQVPEREVSETEYQIASGVACPSSTAEKPQTRGSSSSKIRLTYETSEQGHVGSEFRVLIVGDVHGHWDKSSEAAVRKLKPDLLLFVGDYGERHDTKLWEIARFCGEFENELHGVACATLGNGEAKMYAALRTTSNATYVREQLQQLRPFNPSERPRSCRGVSIVGGRPFSWGGGGNGWYNKRVFQDFLNLSNLNKAKAAIRARVNETPSDEPIVFLAHAGPSGLGNRVAAPCGNDFHEYPRGFDAGDTDLRDAIDYARSIGRRVPLVAFGHFHHTMKRGDRPWREMIAVDGETVHVNAAVVPRIRRKRGRNVHHFVDVRCSQDGKFVKTVHHIWVGRDGRVREQKCLYDVDRGGIIRNHE